MGARASTLRAAAAVLGGAAGAYIAVHAYLLYRDRNFGKETSPAPLTPALAARLKKAAASSTSAAAASPPPSVALDTVRGAGSVDGAVWAELVRAAFVRLLANYRQCNKINVFPIPDGDTGTNMVVTLRSAVRAFGARPPSALGDAMELATAKVLMDAQGNSGTILSFFFSRLRAALSGRDAIAVGDLAEALADVGRHAMAEGCSDPVPGTMLSVLESGTAACNASKPSTLHELVRAWQIGSVAALARTPDQLVVNGVHVLRDARVVDSGAQGFVYMIEGMLAALEGDLEYGDYLCAVSDAAGLADTATGDHGGHAGHGGGNEGSGCDLRFPFCTEAVLQLADGALSDADAKDAVENVVASACECDSAVVVATSLGTDDDGGNLTLAKVHVHTNNPESVFAALRPFAVNGTLVKEKAEDMAAQMKLNALPPVPDVCGRRVRAVTVDLFCLPKELISQEAFRVSLSPLPLTVATRDALVETNSFDLDAIAFWNAARLDTYTQCTTAAPAPDLMLNFVRRQLAEADELVFFVGFKKGSAGWYGLCEILFAQLTPDERSRVKAVLVSAHHGPLYLRAVELVSGGHVSTADELKSELEAMHDHAATNSVLVTDSLDALERWGRLTAIADGAKKFVMKALIRLNLSVCLSWPGNPTTGNAATDKIVTKTVGTCRRRNYRSLFDKAAAEVARNCGDTVVNAVIAHAMDPVSGREVEDALRRHGVRLNRVYRTCAPPFFGIAFGSRKLVAVSTWPAADSKGRTYALS